MTGNEELTMMELEAFTRFKEVEIPPDLEDIIINRLESENMFNKRQKEFTMNNWIYTAAASIAFFAIGYFLAPSGKNKIETTTSIETAPSEFTQYAILLFEDESFRGDDQELIKEYSTWGQDWGQKGKVVGGQKLSYVSKWYGEDFDNALSPGTLSGFFIIQAENYQEALAITETHPHTNYGGRIELREIEKL